MHVSHGKLFLALGCALALLLVAQPSHSQQLKLKPLDWPNDSQFSFGIYNGKGERYATAYYRILKETVKGETLYHFKYLARNESMSESAEVWVDPGDMLPVRSTRKVAGRSKTLYVDCAYQDSRIIVRQKYEGQPVSELTVPVTGRCFDFEALYWLLPQIDWGGSNLTSINCFNTFRFQIESAIIAREGTEQIRVLDKSYPSVRYRFSVGATKYTFWTVDQGGRQVPARIVMDDPNDRQDVSFVNLGLNPKKVKSESTSGLPAAPQGQTPAVPQIPVPPQAPPPPPPPAEEEGGDQVEDSGSEDDEPEPGDENPLVPPSSGGRFR